MSLSDRGAILHFHLDRIDIFGDGHLHSLGWLNRESQLARFTVLAELGDMNGRSVLDIGCGQADLLPFLRQQYVHLDYTGIDHLSNFLKVASQRYGEQAKTRFLLTDFWKASLPPADYVIACGALSYRHRNEDFLFQMIKKLYQSCKIAMGFTLLSKIDQEGGILVSHQAEEVVAFCKTLCQNVVLKADYCPNDFAVFLYR
jgi:SAM-dependent methyltransferase